MFALIVLIINLSNFSFIPSIKKNWFVARYLVKLQHLEETGSLSLGAADERLAFLVMSALSLAAAGGPSQVWGVFKGAAILPGRQWLHVGPCSAFQWHAALAHYSFIFLVVHIIITSILAKCRFMDCTVSTLHQWLSINVDLSKEVYPYTHMSLVCWSYDWVCDGTGNTPIARFTFDHHILFMSHWLKKLRMFIDSHFYS